MGCIFKLFTYLLLVVIRVKINKLFQSTTTLFKLLATATCARLISTHLESDFNRFNLSLNLFFRVCIYILNGTNGNRRFMYCFQSRYFLMDKLEAIHESPVTVGTVQDVN